MAVRKQHNRYRTEPYGKDFESVLKRGKAFHTYGNLHDSFMMTKYRDTWCAFKLPAWGAIPEDAIVYKWNGKKWEKQ